VFIYIKRWGRALLIWKYILYILKTFAGGGSAFSMFSTCILIFIYKYILGTETVSTCLAARLQIPEQIVRESLITYYYLVAL